ncbi:IspD/TarI family cytidylyltransferase [Atopobacter phocae]|uniref:IspD/TarI family cytidylyltransferase n=1 Tax=Atopobacter phocae TaxID=136492 RepID=UPI000471FA9A|nr:IspD/TarI family cytidylyltransferase [Atopobacter phocae]
MATAIVIAGGVGKRMGQDIPKQFILVEGKPILIYTLEAFEEHPRIDQILVVCVEGWEKTLEAYLKKYNIAKVKWIINGGKIGQESIYNAVKYLNNKVPKDEIIVIHDGIRPLIDEFVLSDVIVKTEKYGNAVTSLPYNEQIFIKETENTTKQYIDRNTIRRVSTPQGYRFDLLKDSYDRAYQENIGFTDSSYTNTMMVELGVRLYFAAGSDQNIKLTTKEDLLLFKAHLKMEDSLI